MADVLRITKVEDLTLEQGRSSYFGTLHFLNHQFLFIPANSSKELWVCYSTLRNIFKHNPTQSPAPDCTDLTYPISVLCRHLVYFKFYISREAEQHDVFENLRRLMNITNFENFFCFHYVPSFTMPAPPPFQSDSDLLPNVWNYFNPIKEFERLGVGQGQNHQWRITKINEQWEFSPTYPRYLCVPAKISDNVLRHTAKFRSKARIPVLSYLHRTNNVSITRSSQPMVGIKNNRSVQDEALVKAIFTTGDERPTAGFANTILDARPLTNAMANKAGGAGTEDAETYKSKVIYSNIENIHALRDSWKTIGEVIQTSKEGHVRRSDLDKSGWLKHVKVIIEATLTIVQSVHIGNSHVLIHCSDGWDRTAQLTSLASVCLDPYYRTIAGFCALIEKEWVSFGHKFAERGGHLSAPLDSSGGSGTGVGASVGETASQVKQVVKSSFGSLRRAATNTAASDDFGSTTLLAAGVKESASVNYLHAKEVSPVFSIFLDCVYQIWTQFPDKFEYDERFLTDLNATWYSCMFGEMMFNCEKDRLAFRHSSKPSPSASGPSSSKSTPTSGPTPTPSLSSLGSSPTPTSSSGATLAECTHSTWGYFLHHAPRYVSSTYLNPDKWKEENEVLSSLAVGWTPGSAVRPATPPRSQFGSTNSLAGSQPGAGLDYVGRGIGSTSAVEGTPETLSADGKVLYPGVRNLKWWLVGLGWGGKEIFGWDGAEAPGDRTDNAIPHASGQVYARGGQDLSSGFPGLRDPQPAAPPPRGVPRASLGNALEADQEFFDAPSGLPPAAAPGPAAPQGDWLQPEMDLTDDVQGFTSPSPVVSAPAPGAGQLAKGRMSQSLEQVAAAKNFIPAAQLGAPGADDDADYLGGAGGGFGSLPPASPAEAPDPPEPGFAVDMSNPWGDDGPASSSPIAGLQSGLSRASLDPHSRYPPWGS